jgi:hypothetical protein
MTNDSEIPAGTTITEARPAEAPAADGSNPMLERVRAYVALAREKGKIDADLKQIADQMGDLEKVLLEEFSRNGMQNCKVDGATVYINRRLWAGAAEGKAENLVAALVAIGAGDLVKPKVNSQTLSAWVAEQETDPLGMPILPPEVKELIALTERFGLRVVKK